VHQRGDSVRSFPGGKLKMQKFIAEVSHLIDKDALETSWQSDPTINPNFKVDFGIVDRRILITVESKVEDRWRSESFYNAFSSAVRRVDRTCNVRWL